MKAWSSEKISVLSLVLLITGAIDSVRNLPVTALFGPTLIFFFILSAIVFLIPVALVSAELSSTWSEEEGGVYSWVKQAFGENIAFFTIWLQWINSMVWFPTLLTFIAAIFGYLIDPTLSGNKYYLISVVIIVFWSLTFLSLSGIKASASFASFCAIVGMIIPMGLIILLAIIWLFLGNPIAINLTFETMIPHMKDTHLLSSITAIMTAFLGMELAAVHVRNIHDPQRNFPRAIFFAVILILTTMIFGSLAIAFVLPAEKINLIDAVMQTFDNFLAAYHLSAFMPVVIIMLLLGSLGSMVNWIISPAKGLLLAAQSGFLPHSLCRLNKHGVASRILVLQAIFVSLICSGYLLFPSINAIYWLFNGLSTELYMLMYVFMFAAAWRLKGKFPKKYRPFSIPGGKIGYYLTCIIGLFGCVITLIVGFMPPESMVNFGGAGYYRVIFSSGIVIMILPALCLYFRKHRNEMKVKTVV